MKIKLFALLLGLALAVPSLSGADTVRETASRNTGTGDHDFYNLGAIVGEKPAVYYLAFATPGKIDVASIAAFDDTGARLDIIHVGTRRILFVTFKWIKIGLTRDAMEQAESKGYSVTIVSGPTHLKFAAQPGDFTDLLRDADAIDSNREVAAIVAAEAATKAAKEKAIAATIAAFDPAPLEPYRGRGEAKISGQAFLKTREGDIKIGAGNVVILVPATSWMLNMRELDMIPAQLPSKIRPIVDEIERATEADAAGNFEFSGLPAGVYQIETTITWVVPRQVAEAGGRVARIVTVRENEAVRAMLTR